ncbi:hypothetical protein HXX76_005697 [Chlamydomonas incerta]|uniref:Uncharacterized protein n=1 Tax=Chlamydomonas incerta TaxID=51695 RepID=A0A835W5I6_CHLIN|nr:hypothetical protein HXX76_005697 [Chlamydomonas incerta]|eukprot:KAG2438088.1 hypothetical protein HXX76_005697 [Chlamydomonas incerta]
MARSFAGPLAILLVLFFSAELSKAARLTTILDDSSEASNDLTAADSIDSVLETVSDTAEATNDIVRRFLDTAVGAYPPSPAPPSPQPPAPLDDSLYIDFVDMPAQGAKGTEKPIKQLVWFDDPDFYSQLKGYKPLQLVARPKRANCTEKQCQKCLGAWKASEKQDTVNVFFRDPVQISKIYIKQLLNPGIATVQFLKWKAPQEGATPPRLRGAVVLNQTSDSTQCGDWLTIDVPSDVSGIYLTPTKRGSAEKPKPIGVAKTAVGGIRVTVIRPAGVDADYGPWIEDIHFDGRALYPADPSIYTNYRLYAPGPTPSH